MQPGVTGEFASISRAAGDCPDMAFGRITPDGSIRWIHIPHEQGDGVRALTDLLRAEGYTVGPEPRGKRVWGWRWWLVLKMLLAGKPPRGGRRIPWKYFDKSVPAVPPRPAWTIFTAEQTAALSRAAREQGVSLNSLLLYLLDRTVEPLLSDPSRPRLWMIPVNLRGVVEIPAEEANQTSGITCRIEHGASPADVHGAIREQLRRNRHVHGFWVRRFALRHMNRQRLVERVKQARLRSPRYFVGYFSNVGEWSPAGGEEEVAWCAGAPVAAEMALGSVAMIWRGRLTLTFTVHPGIRDSDQRAQEIIDDWRRRLLELVPVGKEVPAAAAALAGQI